MMNRRDALLSALGAALLEWPLSVSSAPSVLRVRYNAATPEGQDMLNIYASGVKIMKALIGSNPLSWIFQWYIHSPAVTKAQALNQVFGLDTSGPRYQLANASWQTCMAHFNPPDEPFFLPWHRLYVLCLERIIASITSTPTFALPYWNYTVPATAGLPVSFQTISSNNPQYSMLYVANRNVAGPNFANVNAGQNIDANIPPNTLSNSLTAALVNVDYYAFNQQLDNTLHGYIHGLVGNGTNMGSIPSAANDPIFWLHHCNIDRIWYAWNAAGRVNPTAGAWLNRTFTFSDSLGNQRTYPVSMIASSAGLDYTYDNLPAAVTSSPLSRLQLERRTERVLAASTVRGMAATPLELGDQPSTIVLRAVGSSTLRSEAAKPLEMDAVRLVLNGVRADKQPGVLFGLYLDLPPTASHAASNRHFVGMLSFFDAVAADHAGHPGMMDNGGRQIVLNITAAVEQLRSYGLLAENSVITIRPFGPVAPESKPVILGPIELRILD